MDAKFSLLRLDAKPIPRHRCGLAACTAHTGQTTCQPQSGSRTRKCALSPANPCKTLEHRHIATRHGACAFILRLSGNRVYASNVVDGSKPESPNGDPGKRAKT